LLYLIYDYLNAFLKKVSRRTSYFRVWFAFHSYSPIIQVYCKTLVQPFNAAFRRFSVYWWIDHIGFVFKEDNFTVFTMLFCLLSKLTCWLIMQKVRLLSRLIFKVNFFYSSDAICRVYYYFLLQYLFTVNISI